MVEDNKSPETKPDSTIENAKHHLVDNDKNINVYKADVNKLLSKIELLQSELTKLREENEYLRKWKEKWEAQEFMRGRYSPEEVDKLTAQLSKAKELLVLLLNMAECGLNYGCSTYGPEKDPDILVKSHKFLNDTI